MAKPAKVEQDDGKKAKGWKPASQRTDSSNNYVPDYEKVVEAPRRIVAASAALQKRGKTTFGFTMPKPLAYLQLDANYEHALEKARKEYGKDAIKHIRYFADPRGDIKASNAKEFDRFVRDFDYSVDNFKSVLVDTSSELMDVRKIAEWGRTTQIPQIYYGSIYADFRWMVKRALDSDCNVLFAHRMKPEWQAGESTGNHVMDGWRGIQYDAQVYLEHTRDDDGKFSTTIIECAQDALLNGMVLSSDDDECNFATLATRIFSDSELEDWS